jgi:hypothetical protein
VSFGVQPIITKKKANKKMRIRKGVRVNVSLVCWWVERGAGLLTS